MMDFLPEDQPFWSTDDRSTSIALMLFGAAAGLSPIAVTLIWILWGAR